MNHNQSIKLDKSGIPPVLALIMDILSAESHQDFLDIEQKIAMGVDWPLFLKYVRHHRVYPSIYKKLKQFGDNIIPPQVFQAISNDYRANTLNMLRLCSELENVSRKFHDFSIRSLVLKGPLLALEYYGDISLRTCGDLDLLIPIEELELADKILIDSGYEKEDYIQTVLDDWKWRHHHVTYIHPKKQIKIEIHWRLNPGPSMEPSFQDLWTRKSRSDFLDIPVYQLGREDLFMFLVIHGSRHGWSRLRWLLDINQLLRSDISWDSTYVLLNKYHYCHIGAQAMILSNELLGLKLTYDMQSIIKHKRAYRLAQDALYYLKTMVNLHTEPIPTNIASYHRGHLFSLMSFKQKTIFILSFFHPYPEDAQFFPLPNRLHFLYFPLRPILWALRKTKKQAIPGG